MLDEAMSFIDAVEPAFGGDGTLVGLLLQPSDTAIVRASADEAYSLSICIANGEHDSPGEIVSIISAARVPGKLRDAAHPAHRFQH